MAAKKKAAEPIESAIATPAETFEILRGTGTRTLVIGGLSFRVRKITAEILARSGWESYIEEMAKTAAVSSGKKGSAMPPKPDVKAVDVIERVPAVLVEVLVEPKLYLGPGEPPPGSLTRDELGDAGLAIFNALMEEYESDAVRWGSAAAIFRKE